MGEDYTLMDMMQGKTFFFALVNLGRDLTMLFYIQALESAWSTSVITSTVRKLVAT